jgi:hypothetical protein
VLIDVHTILEHFLRLVVVLQMIYIIGQVTWSYAIMRKVSSKKDSRFTMQRLILYVRQIICTRSSL